MGGKLKAPPPPVYREGPYSWPSREQREAYAEALHQLFIQHPATDLESLDRPDALKYARDGQIVIARNLAIMSGVPREHIDSVEALLF